MPYIINSYRFSKINTTDALILSVKTDNSGTSASNQFYLPVYGTNIRVMTSEQDITVNAPVTLEWDASGIYDIYIYGASYVSFNNLNDKLKLVGLKQWGTMVWTGMNNAFYGCSNMVGSYTDSPNTSSCTSFSATFANCILFNSTINFDVGNATTMLAFLENCVAFNSTITLSNSSGITNYSRFLNGCNSFNQPLTGISTSAAVNLSQMLSGCYVFNQSVSHFVTSNVTDMSSMFLNARAFNQSVSNFNTSNVTTMSNMFASAHAFNQNINSFDFSKVTTMLQFISNYPHTAAAHAFNNGGVAINWNNAICTNMQTCFYGNYSLNVGVTLSTTVVTTMLYFMYACNTFNQTVTIGSTANATTMQLAFTNCSALNNDFAKNFNVSNVANFTSFMQGVTLSSSNYDNILVAWNSLDLVNNLAVNFGSSKYTTVGQAAKNQIIADDNWTFTDGGLE